MANFTTALVNKPILSGAGDAPGTGQGGDCNAVRIVQNEKHVRQIDPSHDETDDRDEDIILEGGDDGSEYRADNRASGETDDAAPQGEVADLFED